MSYVSLVTVVNYAGIDALESQSILENKLVMDGILK